ncbi:MAG: hypothetical protein NT076_01280 [Candidatus Pacearchaeota archaeon]|nr:hypothetical protein [Candidatus Pacearchaeota archaeon]
MEDSDNVNQKNITDKWLDNVYQSLMKLEDYERLAKEGCSSIVEYVQSISQNKNFQMDMAQLQKKNYDFFITEFEVLLNNIRHLIDKQTYLRMQIKLFSLVSYEQEVDGFLQIKVNQMEHTEWFILKPEFYNNLNQISELRGLAVNSLWKLLSPNAKENLEGLPQ